MIFFLDTHSREEFAGFRSIMDKAPDADREVMADPVWQEGFSVGTREALRRGFDGWFDEALVIFGDWADVDVEGVKASVTWWHSTKDASAPLTAARRVLDRLSDSRLILFGDNEGHLPSYHREGSILDELLARG